jgi:hypothetical protein
VVLELLRFEVAALLVDDVFGEVEHVLVRHFLARIGVDL